MKIAFLGTGSMAQALATKWQKDYSLFFAGRDVKKTQSVAEKFNGHFGSSAEAVAFADVIVLATRYEQVFDAIEQAGGNEAFKGKTVIDINNPVDIETFTTTIADGKSLTDCIQNVLPDVQIIKAFNTDQADVWSSVDMNYGGKTKVSLYTADTTESEKLGAELIRAVGSEPLLIGSNIHAYQLEALAAMTIKRLFGSAPSTTTFQYIERL